MLGLLGWVFVFEGALLWFPREKTPTIIGSPSPILGVSLGVSSFRGPQNALFSLWFPFNPLAPPPKETRTLKEKHTHSKRP